MTSHPHTVPASAGSPLRAGRRLGFAFGRRCYLLFALGLCFIGPAYYNPRFVWMMVAWNAGVLLAWFLDLRSLPPAAALHLSRHWAAPLVLGRSGEFRLVLTGGRQSLDISLAADLPPQLATQPFESNLQHRPGAQTEITVPVHPVRRGDLEIGPAFLRYRSPVGLAERWARADITQTVRVFPSLGADKEHSLSLLRSRRIEIQSRLARRKGVGREFESLRDYREGDSFRDISWAATARRGRLIVKEYQIERSQPVWLLVDCGRLMRARVDRFTKLDFAASAALHLAQVADFGGDRVGLLAYGQRQFRMVNLARGQQHLAGIMNQLSLVSDEPAESDHLRAAATLLRRQSRRSLVVWITDLPDTAMMPEVIEAASVLLHRHLVMFAVIDDAQLRQAANAPVRGTRTLYRATAASEVFHRREKLIAGLRGRGAQIVEVGAGDLPAAIVERYLSLKEQGRL